MKTGATSARLEQAATYLKAAAFALTNREQASYTTFGDALHQALHLISEVLLNSEKLTEQERFALRSTYGTRLLGINDCDSCWEAISACAIKLPSEEEEEYREEEDSG